VRLTELHIEHFGIFSDKRLVVDDSGFQLIAGPNEAGKTTLLQAIRETLFGFEYRNPYDFTDARSRMAASAVLLLRDGSELRFRRQKGRPDQVVGERQPAGSGAGAAVEVDAAALAASLGGASAALFANVFGFSLRELVEGEKSLDQANLSEAFFGAGMGSLAAFQKTRQRLQGEMESLFTPGARKHKLVVEAVGALKQNRKALQEAVVKPRDYEKRRAHLKQCEQRAKELDERREAIRRTKAREDRIRQALPVWSELRECRRRFDALPEVEGAPQIVLREYEKHLESLNRLQKQLDEDRSNLEKVRARLDRLQRHPELIDHKAEIKRLAADAGRIRERREHVPQRRGESRTIRDAVAARIVELSPDWGLDVLDRFRVDLPQRNAMDELAGQIDALEKRAAALRERREQQGENLRRIEGVLAEIGAPPDLTPLSAALKREADYRSDLKERRQLDLQDRSAAEELDRLVQRLASSIDAAEVDFSAIGVPLPAAVDKFHERIKQADADRSEAKRRLDEAKERCEAAKAELARHERLHPAPPRQQVEQSRDRRDAGWRLVRRKYVEGERNGVEAEIAAWRGGSESDLPNLYEQVVAEADRLADERQDKAEAVARREQLAADVEQHEQRAGRAAERLAECDAARNEAQTAWQALWRDSGLAPRSPAEMRAWLDLRAKYVARMEEHREVCRRLEHVRERIDEFAAALRQAMDLPADAAEPEIDVLLQRATGRLEQANKAAASRAAAERELPQVQRGLQQTENELRTIDDERKTLDRRRRELLAEIGLPTGWGLATAKTVLAELSAARAENDKAIGLDERASIMEEEIAAYERQSREVLERLAPDLVAVRAEHAVEELVARLETAEAAARDHEHLSKEMRQAESRVRRAEKEIQSLNETLESLLARAGVSSHEELSVRADAAQQRAELARDIAEGERGLASIRATEPENEFLAQLESADADELERRAERSEEELDELNRQYDEAREELGRARDRVQQVDEQHFADELAVERQAKLAELAAAIDRYAPLAIACRMLDASIERFEREQQPELLVETSRLLEAMTGGRYVEVTRPLDSKEGGWLLREPSGDTKRPEQLSTGTREQLYLAIRLAYARHYCRGAEPLPMVMDDVLANFDDQRAEAALRVLLELAEECQILFMTCHQSMVDLAAKVAPGARPIELTA
jgi:uncharacterized protein YhaN